MEIGRKLLSESEFSNLWGVLYQEFYNLSMTNTCDATLVYNTIYIICTSGSSFESKLYWKIGDFLLSRCKVHKEQISKASDYIAEYIVRFEEYQQLVESIHSLGSFLNDSVREKKLNEFGYLLWERIVIQPLANAFFIDVFQYKGDVMKILKSFEKIVPDVTQKLLYYKEKYEKIVMQHIRQKYKSVPFSNLLEFCEIIREIVGKECEYMKKYMLEYSYEQMKYVLEECLLAEKYYELIFNLKNFYQIHNQDSHISFGINTTNQIGQGFLVDVNSLTREMIKNEDSKSEFKLPPNSGQKRIVEPTEIIGFHPNIEVGVGKILFESFSMEYVNFNDQTVSNVKTYIDDRLRNNRILSPLHVVINKGRDGGFELFTYKTYNPIFTELMNSLGMLDIGFVLIKKSYAMYVQSTIERNQKILEGSVRDIYYLLQALDIFYSSDCQYILHTIFRQHLLRTKPCFMKRLCDFTKCMVSVNPSTSVDVLRPFNPDENSKIFRISTELICDRSEFMSMYQNALKERIISGSSSLKEEYAILSSMNVPRDDKLFKMLQEIENNRSQFKLLNATYWAIEPDNSSLVLPTVLLNELKATCPNLVVSTTKGRGSQYSPSSENAEMKYKLKGLPQEKTVYLAHQYSTVDLVINGVNVRMNMYQYVAFDNLCKEAGTADDLSKACGISLRTLNRALKALTEYRFIRHRQGIYSIDCSEIKSRDISAEQGQEERALDVCVDSYIQALGVRILKRAKIMDVDMFLREIKEQSRSNVDDDFVAETLKKLVDKGLLESKNGIIEYIP